MLSPVRFYRMKGGLTSGEYPLFSTGQGLTEYLVHEASGVKHTQDIQQVVKVPRFEGYNAVNVCEIDGLYYWVTAFHENTIEQSSIRFVLDLMAPTSFIRKGDTLTGIWKKSPYISNNRRMKQPVSNDVLKETRSVAFDTITMPSDAAEKMGSNVPDKVFWVQISSVAQKLVLGCFASYRDAYPFAQPGGQPSYTKNVWAVRQGYAPTSINPYYPTINEILTKIYDITGQTLTAEQVDNISISDKCPYSYSHEVIDTRTQSSQPNRWTLHYWLNSGSYWNQPGSYYFYDLAGSPPTPAMKTKTVTLSEMEAVAGNVVIRDSIGNTIMTVPCEYVGTDGSLTISYNTYSDMSGLYTNYQCGVIKETRPEGKLPWIGSAVATYNAYSWDSDRLALQYANNDAKRGFETDWNYYMGQAQIDMRRSQRSLDESSIMAFGSFITGGIFSGAGGQLVSNYFTQQHLKEDAIEDQSLLAKKLEGAYSNLMQHNEEQFNLTQKRAISQPNPTYNTGYGMTYCHNALFKPCRVSVDLPANITDDYYNNYISEFGYVTEGKIDMVMQEGFYSGSLLSDGQLVGLYFDELNKDFMRGFKFVEIESDD